SWALALIGWLASGQSTVGLLPVLGIGTDGWLLAHGGRIDVGQAHIAITPLFAWAGIVWLIARGARSIADVVGGDGPRWRGWLPRDLAIGLGCFALSYAGVVAAASLLALSTPARPDPLWVLPAVLLTLLVGIVAGVVRSGIDLPELALATRRVPAPVRRALPSAAHGALVLLGTGASVVVLAVVVGFSQVTHVTAELAPGFVGGLILLTAQLLALPNLALWAVSFLGGSGFQVVAGQPIDWTGAHSGLLPMVPALAALPSPGAFPWAVRVVVLVPIVVGGLVGRRALGSVARLSQLRTRMGVAASAAVGSAVILGLLDLVGGGALGAYRIGAMGAPALLMTAVLAVELTLGALAYTLWDGWRLRRT
ncbi:MAG: DUF6350 family protein, partial [Nostocoides sp.]